MEDFLVLWDISPCGEHGNILPACDPGKRFGGASGLVGSACLDDGDAGSRGNSVLAGDDNAVEA